MKMNVKEIKAKGENDDKIKFTGKVKNVYDAKDLTPEQRAKAKYTVSRQNIMVGDDSDSIKVIVSHKKKEHEYTKDIVGREVEVDGKISLWEGDVNVFGKLVFKTGEEPIKKDASTMVKPATTSILPTGMEIRRVSLKRAMEFWQARIGEPMEEAKILATADVFCEYISGNIKIEKVSGQKKEQKSEESKELEEKKEGEQVIKPETNTVPLINEIMQLKEDHHLDAETFAVHCDKKDIKTLSIEELKVLKKKLENLTEEIPF